MLHTTVTSIPNAYKFQMTTLPSTPLLLIWLTRPPPRHSYE